jgi:hypothetical protein
MASGNDYLPALRGLLPAKDGLRQLWAAYLAVRASKRYSARWGASASAPWTDPNPRRRILHPCYMQLHSRGLPATYCIVCRLVLSGSALALVTRAFHGVLLRTLVKRNVKTGALAFDSGVLTKMLEKRGVAPPLSEAAAAAWDENTGGQLLPADALEYLQVLGHYTPRLTT